MLDSFDEALAWLTTHSQNWAERLIGRPSDG